VTDATLRIKNLSIALEALSRINSPGAFEAFSKIGVLLDTAIQEVEKETQWPPRARPAKPGPHGDREYPDEDIS